MVTYEEYDQHNDEKHNPDVKEKLGIRIVDLVQQGLGQVELQFVLMWVETLLITIKNVKKTIEIPTSSTRTISNIFVSPIPSSIVTPSSIL